MTNEYRHRRMKMMRIVTFLLFIFMVFFLPDFLFAYSNSEAKLLVRYIRPIDYTIAFLFNYYVLIPKFLFEKHKKWAFVACNLLLAIFVLAAVGVAHSLGDHPGPHNANFPPPPRPQIIDVGLVQWLIMSFGLLSRDFIFLILTIGLSIAYRLSEKWVTWETLQKEYEAERKESELKSLKNQLNPHFLFNTLNNIYSLIAINQQKAQLAVHELSQMLRYMLYENKEELIPLNNELRFVNNYIELMKLRLPASTSLTANVNENDGIGKQIAPFMFISLVENAFKHGVSTERPSFINISIKVIDGKVVCTVANSYFPKHATDKSGSGIGIENLKKQVEILYPNRYSFESHHDCESFTTKLEIEL